MARHKTCKRGHDRTAPGNDGLRCKACKQILRSPEYLSQHVPGKYTPRKPKTHCKQGHELTGPNAYHHPAGRVKCRKCQEGWGLSYRRRHGVRPRPEPRNEVERWNRILQDAGLGVYAGGGLANGDNALALAEAQVIRKRFGKGKRRPRAL